jgi:hypothetical protein
LFGALSLSGERGNTKPEKVYRREFSCFNHADEVLSYLLSRRAVEETPGDDAHAAQQTHPELHLTERGVKLIT